MLGGFFLFFFLFNFKARCDGLMPKDFLTSERFFLAKKQFTGKW